MSKIELEPRDKKKFLELLSRRSSYGQYEIRLGMSVRDVERYKFQIGVSEPEDARSMLRREEASFDEVQMQTNKRIAQNKQTNDEAQKRQNAREAADRKKRNENRSERSPADVEAIQREDRERQERFEAQQQEGTDGQAEYRITGSRGDWKVISRTGRTVTGPFKNKAHAERSLSSILSEQWQVDEESEDEFIQTLNRRGISFTASQYGVEKSDVVREGKRLNVTVEMVKR